MQRHLDRQHRAGSPACFDAAGRHRSGGCDWDSRSAAARRSHAQVADLHRVLAARRKSDHGALVNRLLALGPHLRAEQLNYVAWQKMFPRSVRDRAPGAFVEQAHRKAESAGGSFYDYDPRTTALSQHCVCGERSKKSLSQRVHRCLGCGLDADRDLLAAYLGLFVALVDGKDTLDLVGAAEALTPRRHDIAVAPQIEVYPAGAGKQRVRRRRPPGRRSLVRIAKRHRKAASPTELLGAIPTPATTPRPDAEVPTRGAGQPSPTALVAA